MIQYYELDGVNFSFDYADGYCSETGASDSDIYNIDVEEITDPYDATKAWLDMNDAAFDAYLLTFQPWNQEPGRTPDELVDLPGWVYDRVMADIAERINALDEDILAEALIDAYEPDTFSTWD